MSDTPKFTLGPWEDTGLYIEKNGAVIACAPDHREFSLLEARANARLIAAAPDQHAQLKSDRNFLLILLDVEIGLAGAHQCIRDQITRIDAVLAKAVRL